jgi:hypothetical protein
MDDWEDMVVVDERKMEPREKGRKGEDLINLAQDCGK